MSRKNALTVDQIFPLFFTIPRACEIRGISWRH